MGFVSVRSLSCLVIVNSKSGRSVDSPELVPGDIYEVSDPSLTQFPCDSILLSGDCIVNESMLTGECHETRPRREIGLIDL